MPKRTSPFAARPCRLGIGRWSSIHRILVAEKYGSTIRPVRDQMSSALPESLNPLQISAVRWSCHTMALASGLPDLLSHKTVVSRWFVIPIAAMSEAETPDSASAIRAVPIAASAISNGSCSTQPGCGKI